MPEALSILAGRSGAIDKVIQGLEGAYQNAGDDATKEDLEKKAFHYIADSLATVAKDIENVGGEGPMYFADLTIYCIFLPCS